MLDEYRWLSEKKALVFLLWMVYVLLFSVNRLTAETPSFTPWEKVFQIEKEMILDYRYPDGFLNEGVGVSPDGESFVLVDWEKKRVAKFDREGNLSKILAKEGRKPDQVSFPLCVEITRDGNVYIGDNQNRRVSQFSPEGKFLRSFVITPDHWPPRDIETDGEGSLFLIGQKPHVPEEDRHSSGDEIEQDRSPGAEAGEADHASLIDSARGKWVNKYTNHGKYVESFAYDPAVVSELNLWKGVTANAAMDEEEDLYLLFTPEHKVHKFSRDGGRTDVFGENPEWFVSPQAPPAPGSFGYDEEEEKRFWKSWTQPIKILYAGEGILLTVTKTNGLVEGTDSDFLINVYSKDGRLLASEIETDYFPFGIDSSGHVYFRISRGHQLNIAKTRLKEGVLK